MSPETKHKALGACGHLSLHPRRGSTASLKFSELGPTASDGSTFHLHPGPCASHPLSSPSNSLVLSSAPLPWSSGTALSTQAGSAPPPPPLPPPPNLLPVDHARRLEESPSLSSHHYIHPQSLAEQLANTHQRERSMEAAQMGRDRRTDRWRIQFRGGWVVV